jgi:hypothetical protein
LGLTNSANLFKRSSGTAITPTFGSIVQKGKFAACAFVLDKQLKRVDLPTLGKPTMPHCSAIELFGFNYIVKRFYMRWLLYKYSLSPLLMLWFAFQPQFVFKVTNLQYI